MTTTQREDDIQHGSPTNLFEEIVYRLMQFRATPTARVRPNANVTDTSSGTQRQVDIICEDELFGHKLRIAIECRDRRDPQDITWIDGVVGRSVPVDLKLAASASGFTKSARLRARASRVGCLTLETVSNAALGEDVSSHPILLGKIKRIELHGVTPRVASLSGEESSKHEFWQNGSGKLNLTHSAIES